ncbi:hypothetical protein fugu_012202 [Takifugu bimaculatus]|uniref:ZP domain-containing protein n=1 Tax=Takifugu bimaculatus TaxID=433685 RepID=A0A4Z2C9V0_9TELE|nr:hypothetical protein fugu_012202 [Takifugu bimaculatus]
MLLLVVKLNVLLLLGFACRRVEGLCNVQACVDSSTCVRNNQRSCKCINGYYGDHCDKNADIKVLCSRHVVGISAKEDFFRYHNVSLELLYLPNATCLAARTTINNATYYDLRIPKAKYGACGGKPLEKNLTHITYSLSLVTNPEAEGNIIRNPVIRLDYKCIFPYVRRASLPFSIIPFTPETMVRVDDLDAVIQMRLYTDHTYSEAYRSSPSIELRSKVYVEVKVTEPVDFFLLRINKCWATQVPHPNATEGSHHVLLQNGCPDDHTVSFPLNGTGHNGESSTVRYSFDMFRFTTEPLELYLHCTVQLCAPGDPDSCKPSCSSISKREAVRADPTLGLLTYGPIKVDVPEMPQSNLWMAVALPVAAVWTVGCFFLILITVAKAGSRRLTKNPACRS